MAENKKTDSKPELGKDNKSLSPDKATPIADVKPAEGKVQKQPDAKKVEAKVDTNNVEVKTEDKKAEVKAEDKKIDVKADDKKAEVKAEDKKVEVKAEDKKVEVKADDKKVEVKTEDKKAEVKADDKKVNVKAEDKKVDIKAKDKKVDIKADEKVVKSDSILAAAKEDIKTVNKAEKIKVEDKKEEETTEDVTTSTDLPKDNTPIGKKPSKIGAFIKKNKPAVIITCIALVLVIAALTVFLVLTKGQVVIRNAEDFSTELKDSDTRYVLKDDVTVNGDLTILQGMNLDLNDHVLIVNGTLTYDGVPADKKVIIGDITRKDGIFANSRLEAEDIIFNANSAELVIYSPIISNMHFTAIKITSKADLTALNDGEIILQASTSLIIEDNITIPGTTAGICTLSGTTVEISEEIVLPTVGSSLNINCTTTKITAKLTANTITIIGTSEISADVTAATLSTTGTIVAEGTFDCDMIITNATLDLTDNRYLSILNGTFSKDLSLINANILLQGNVQGVVNLDDLSTLKLEGTVDSSIIGALAAVDASTSGAKVVLKETASCGVLLNVELVEVYDGAVFTDIENAATVNFYHYLSTPSDVTVVQEGNKIMCYVANTINAENYVIYIDGEEAITSPNSNIDITALIVEPKQYTIDAKITNSDPLFLDSELVSTDYTYAITLATPQITLNTNGNEYKIEFANIPFATKYKYTINNEDYEYDSFTAEDAAISIDITEEIVTAGSYVVKVKSYGSDNETYKPSEVSTLSFKVNIALSTPTLAELPLDIVLADNTLTVDWDAVPNAKYYQLVIDTDPANTIYTTNTIYQCTLGDITDNSTIQVYANTNGYYDQSAPSIVNYEFETLENPVVTTDASTANTIVLNWLAVDGVTGYEVYLGETLVSGEDLLTETTYSINYVTANVGTYTVKTIKEFYRAGVGTVVVPASYT